MSGTGKKAAPENCCSEVPVAAKVLKKSMKMVRAEEVHPDHSVHIKKLNRVIGQVQGIQRMIEDRRYCPDILVQSRAAASALRAIENAILEQHIRHCVSQAVSSTSAAKSDAKLEELIDLLHRF